MLRLNALAIGTIIALALSYDLSAISHAMHSFALVSAALR